MSIFDKDGNKSYKEYELSTESREKIKRGILEGINIETAASKSELDVRRIEKMKKENKYAALMKKVAVASVSLIASGAIIFGLTKYNDIKDVNVSKNTVATESTKEKKDTEKEEDNINVVNEDIYINVFQLVNVDSDEIVHSNLSTAQRQVKYGDNIFELEGDLYNFQITNDDERKLYKWFAIKRKDDKEFIEVKDFKFEDEEDVYSNGKYIISMYDKCINIYDIAANKLDVIDVCKDKKIKKENYDKYSLFQEKIISIKNDIVYFRIDKASDNQIYDLISYNINTKEIKIEKENIYTADNYFYEYMVVQYKDPKYYNILSLFAYTSNGLVEEKIISKNTELRHVGISLLGVPYLGDIEGKKDKLKNEYESMKKATVYIYDVQSGENKEMAKVDIKEFGEDAKKMFIGDLFEDYCEVYITYKDKRKKTFKYIYATKKIEEE